MSDAREALEFVIRAHGTMMIIYDGGSASGTARAVAPIAVTRDMLVATCLETNRRKTFHLDKIRIATDEPIISRPLQASEDAARMAVLMSMDLQQLFEATAERAGERGWSLELDGSKVRASRGEDEVRIVYAPMLQGAYVDADGKPIEIASERRWHVDGKLYAHKNRAFAAFQDAVWA